MQLTHSTPMAGHVGVHRTKYKIQKNFYWPYMGKDIRITCQACSRCQKTANKTHSKAPMLTPVVRITQDFKVAIDVVGPLPLTRSKNCYILTYIDLRYPYVYAVPLCTTTAKVHVVAEKLLYIMSRLSVPLEILSKQGSNFMSTVMKEVFSFLGIHHSKTAPY